MKQANRYRLIRSDVKVTPKVAERLARSVDISDLDPSDVLFVLTEAS